VPIYFSDEQPLLERLASRLEESFQIRTRTRNPWFDPEVSYDRARGQYNSTVLLRMLLDDPQSSEGKILGITSVDLFIPVLTYVFGEAQLQGRAATVSIHRLRPEAYGLPSNDALLYRRLETEAVHELGHTYGLVHCNNATCVMRASTYAEDIDLKSPMFCRACLDIVRRRG